MEDMLKVFHASQGSLAEGMSESLKGKLTDEIFNNVFNNQKRSELCLNE